MLERDVKAYLQAKVKERGGEMRKIRWEGRNAAPDWLVMLPPRELLRVWHPGKHALVELKRPGRGAEALQAEEHATLRRFGFDVAVLDSKEAIDEFLW